MIKWMVLIPGAFMTWRFGECDIHSYDGYEILVDATVPWKKVNISWIIIYIACSLNKSSFYFLLHLQKRTLTCLNLSLKLLAKGSQEIPMSNEIRLRFCIYMTTASDSSPLDGSKNNGQISIYNTRKLVILIARSSVPRAAGHYAAFGARLTPYITGDGKELGQTSRDWGRQDQFSTNK